jgi:glucosamine--fructose-6-phosphate aminotransferase (isomerizing)
MIPRCGRRSKPCPGGSKPRSPSDWSAAEAPLAEASSLYVLGRGPAFPIALEAALKAKEIAALHAEAFSIAEVMHGPLRLVQRRFPVLAFVPDDEAAAPSRAALDRLIRVGADVTVAAGSSMPGRRLASVATGHRHLDPLAMIVSYYRLIETVCRLRGHDPDRPPNLAKVTETI